MKQVADALLLIRPSQFGFNPETAASNSFQNQIALPDPATLAVKEFDAVLQCLNRENIETIVADDIPESDTPDAVFPNNWVSFHEDNRVVLYPMMAPNRRKERRKDVVESVAEQRGLYGINYLDLTSFEKENKFLEGTGSVVFDHQNRTAYAALSPRTHKEPFEKLVTDLGYSGNLFQTRDSAGTPVYHTNVLLSIGIGFAVVCDEVIYPEKERNFILEQLEKDHRLILINAAQMAAFAGNVLQIANRKGEPYILLSDTALHAFSKSQLKQLENFATLLPVPLENIERIGGGSIRCMVAEVFLQATGSNDAVLIKNPDSRELQEAFNLRWKVLRAPWNQPVDSERDDQENSSHHFVAVIGKKIVGTARLQQLRPGTAQLRYMAIDPGYQGKGIGSKLISFMERSAREKGWKSIFLQSRENAVEFYKSNGYTVIEKTYLLFDSIQHYSMEKQL